MLLNLIHVIVLGRLVLYDLRQLSLKPLLHVHDVGLEPMLTVLELLLQVVPKFFHLSLFATANLFGDATVNLCQDVPRDLVLHIQHHLGQLHLLPLHLV